MSANNVWGDIKRNNYLLTISNAPKDLTPGENNELHPSLKPSMQKSLERMNQPIKIHKVEEEIVA